jgi:hypothetical protein
MTYGLIVAFTCLIKKVRLIIKIWLNVPFGIPQQEGIILHFGKVHSSDHATKEGG